MNKKKINKNLKHGYIFLTSLVLLCFLTSFGIEMYLDGNLSLQHHSTEKPKDEEISEIPDSGFFLELENIKTGFETEDSQITIVGTTQSEAKIMINEDEVELNDQNRFEKKIDLIIGKNFVNVKGFLGEKLEKELNIEIIRKAKEEKPATTPKDDNGSNSNSTAKKESPKATPQPKPTPTPEPKPSPITGLKLSCSINNTYPSVGQSVSVNCILKDQNSKPVQGAIGSATVGWKTGNSVYNFSSSNSSGAMSINFIVPAGNTGAIVGNIKISKAGLTVTSNFTLNVQ